MIRILWAGTKMILSLYKEAGGKCVMKKLTTAKLAVCSRSVWMGNVVRNHFKLACVFLSARWNRRQPGADCIYSPGTGGAWHFHHYRRNHSLRKNFWCFHRSYDRVLVRPVYVQKWTANSVPEMASLPLALSTVLVFWSPIDEKSWLNAAFLLVMVLAYYLSITAYCTPYNALIPGAGTYPAGAA